MCWPKSAGLTIKVGYSKTITHLMVATHAVSAGLLGISPIPAGWRLGGLLFVLGSFLVALRRLSLQTGWVIDVKSGQVRLNGESNDSNTAELLFGRSWLVILRVRCKSRTNRVFVISSDAVPTGSLRRLLFGFRTST